MTRSLQARIAGWPALRGLRWTDEQAERYYREGWWDRRGLDRLLAEHAQRSPGKVACSDGVVELTFAELALRAQTLAVALLDHGLSRGDVVLVRAGNSVDHVVLHFALAGAGLVSYELPADAPTHAVVAAIERTEASALCGDEPVAAPVLDALRAPRLVVAMAEAGEGDGSVGIRSLMRGPTRPLAPQDPDDVATLIPTSGTTGTPKIVMRSANCSLAMARAVVARSGVVADDVLLVAAPLNGGVGFINAIGSLALTGCTLIVPRTLHADALLALIEQHRVTRVATLPTVATRLLSCAALSDTDVSSLRVVQTGGSFLQPARAEELERAFGCTVVIVYGAIDVGAPAMISARADPPEHRYTTVGRAAPGAELAVMSPDGSLLGAGEPGEVVMRGPDTALGYFDDADATARVFDAGGWGHFGDLGVIDDAGYLRLVGRLKEIINRGGKKISIAEVESAVATHPSVRDVAAVGYPDDDLGERCAVFVVVADGGPGITLATLKDHLERHGVPKYLWPERLEEIDTLPLAPSGKVHRDALRRRLTQPEEERPRAEPDRR